MSIFVSKILFPIHEIAKGHRTIGFWKDLMNSEWYDSNAIRELQRKKLENLLLYAYENVSYYREIVDSCKINLSKFDALNELSRLPLLTKQIIKDNLDELKSGKAKNLIKSNTGGSTGLPLIFYQGKRRVSADVAAKRRATQWWGVDIGDPEIVIWGSPVELTKQDRFRAFRDRLFRTHLLSAFDMSSEKMAEYLSFIRNFRPRHVFGYPSSIYILCKFAQREGVDLNDLGVKVVFVTAERLYDYQRELINDTFGAPVANGYGGRDSGFIAHECPQGGMHITAENIILEVIDRECCVLPPGKRGEIVVTQLETHDFPFIRYRTGDVGVLSDQACPCGRGLPLLKEVEGRTTDFIIAPDGRIMHGLSLIYVLRETNGIEEFKIIQEGLDNFLVQIVTVPSFNSSNEENIRKGFQERLGKDVIVRFDYPEVINPEKSGKFRYVVSKVAEAFI
ncbi:MAG: phenylacetate--CoA ligase family protein [Candidatus Brocadiaceae bacterium]|nr:phenylacetate--CoA ligase family protein [Candidatus Brocadiaceae bacterium]